MEVGDDALGRTVRHESGAGTQPDADPCWVGDRVDAIRPSLVLDRAATAHNATAIRREFARWLAVDVADGDQAEDLVLVVYEALANVVDHAYSSGEGPVRLVAHRTQLAVRVTVADDGRWQPRSGSPFRNHGLSVMRMLIAQVHVASTASGTTVHLSTAFPEPVV